jgi:hypothetical protein
MDSESDVSSCVRDRDGEWITLENRRWAGDGTHQASRKKAREKRDEVNVEIRLLAPLSAGSRGRAGTRVACEPCPRQIALPLQA